LVNGVPAKATTGKRGQQVTSTTEGTKFGLSRLETGESRVPCGNKL
jgi:hypothetical protein